MVRWHDGVHPDFSRVCILSKCQKRRSNRGPPSEKLPPYQIDSALFRERGSIERNGAFALELGRIQAPQPHNDKKLSWCRLGELKKTLYRCMEFFWSPPRAKSNSLLNHFGRSSRRVQFTRVPGGHRVTKLLSAPFVFPLLPWSSAACLIRCHDG